MLGVLEKVDIKILDFFSHEDVRFKEFKNFHIKGVFIANFLYIRRVQISYFLYILKEFISIY